MLVRFYGHDGQFLEESVLDKPPVEHEPITLRDGKRYSIIAAGGLQVDWGKNVFFVPVMLELQK